MMGIGSLFCLSRGLSVLVEVVRMLNVGKKGKPAKGVVRLLRRLGSLRRFDPTLWVKATAAVLGSLWVSTAGRTAMGVTDGSESLPALARRTRKGAPDGFSGGLHSVQGHHQWT
jgi:hypothetical protein